MAEAKKTSAAAKPAATKAAAPKAAPKNPVAKSAPAKTAATQAVAAPARHPGEQFRGKRYRAAAEQVEDGKQYGLDEAVALVQKTSTTKFDGTVEIHIRLGIDAREAEQSVRGTVQLPAGTGKKLKVMAFVASAKAAAAKKAGADFVSDEDTLKKLKDGWTGFDVAVASPDQMAEVGKLGKVLGPKGLMPNPKSGTVAEDVEGAIKKVKAGSIEFRVAKDATIHAGVGKTSFKAEDLAKNVATYFGAVRDAKPSDAKGTYIRSVTLASTMGPGVRVNPDTITAAA
ncbi:MAG: 50S ribosomal protein L1 [bacterium]|nr:50S ribosomal protein L1 [bacterium]MDZ4248113.1 50S ribosomal protein L1 [Patescibacteria group bacterium]